MFTATECIYSYDASFDGFLSCIFESFQKKERPFDLQPAGTADQLTLHEVRTVPTQSDHARRVECFLPRCLGDSLYRECLFSYLSGLPHKELLLLTLIQETYAGRHFNLGESPLFEILSSAQRVKREAHHLMGFLRFSDQNGNLAAVIHPENQVLPLLVPHFRNRLPEENWLIYDAVHHWAAACRRGQAEIFSLEDLILPPPSEEELRFQKLWTHFCRMVAIPERRNPRLQQQMLPRRFWPDMPEMQG